MSRSVTWIYRNYSTRLLQFLGNFGCFFEKSTFPSSSITLISSPFSSKKSGWESLWISDYYPLSIKLFPSAAFLFFTHNRLGLICDRENRSLHIPANKLPILWALTPLSSLSYQKWSLHICSQSLWAPSPPTLPSAISSPVCSPHSRKWASWAPKSLVTLFFFKV